MLSCNVCSKTFSLRGNYNAHLKRKKPCYQYDSQDNCKYCLKKFSNKYNKTRHETTCSKRVAEELLKPSADGKIQALENKIKELETMIKQGINPIPSVITNTMTTNNTVIQNFFVINKYGHEDLSHLTDSQKLNNLRKIYMSIPSFILLKHFDKDHPENSNVYVSNLKTPYALIYNGNSWVVTDRNKLLQEMYDDNYCEVIHNYKEMKAQLDDKTIDAFRRFLNDQDDDKLISKMKNDIKLILYNNRDQVIKLIK